MRFLLALLIALGFVGQAAASSTFQIVKNVANNTACFWTMSPAINSKTVCTVAQTWSGSTCTAATLFWTGGSSSLTFSGTTGVSYSTLTAGVNSHVGNFPDVCLDLNGQGCLAAWLYVSDINIGGANVAAYLSGVAASSSYAVGLTDLSSDFVAWYMKYATWNPAFGSPTVLNSTSFSTPPAGWPSTFNLLGQGRGIFAACGWSQWMNCYTHNVGYGGANFIVPANPQSGGVYDWFYVWQQTNNGVAKTPLATKIGTGPDPATVFAGSDWGYYTSSSGVLPVSPPFGGRSTYAAAFNGVPVNFTWNGTNLRYEASNGYYLQFLFPSTGGNVYSAGWYLSQGAFSFP